VEVLGRYSKLPKLPNPPQETGPSRQPTERPRTHKVAQRLDAETIAQIVTAYEAGQTSIELATRYGVSKNAVLRLLRDRKIEIRHQPLTLEQLEEAVRLYQSGLSLAKVGAHFGRDASFIHLAFKRHGIPRRDTHGRQR
jgi:predicted HTH domain antitoxin